ncbi:MAG: hypothetical protein JXX28_10145, partial [Deltaproteobacteria bacterium]|nr:hypothetical protein [Deltaproteobacteria bacterium]
GVEACAQPAGFVGNADDCDDGCADCHDGGAEVCDGLDNDCDHLVDEGVKDTFWADRDDDGYGDPLVSVEACEAPPHFVLDDQDCDDEDPEIHPSADEPCGVEDRDCDGVDPAWCESCLDLRDNGEPWGSGTYTVQPATASAPYPVWCDMSAFSGGWTRVYYQDSTNYGDGQARFFAQGQSSANPAYPDARLYAILDRLEQYRRGGRLEFLMRWPGHATWTDSMQWSQTSNPVTASAGATPVGYSAIHIPYTSNGWSAGLQHSYFTQHSLLDGTLNPLGNWYYAVGTTYCWGGEPNPCQPAPSGGAHKVELLVR